MNKEQNKKIAEDTLKIIENQQYKVNNKVIKLDINKAVNETILYDDKTSFEIDESIFNQIQINDSPNITVTTEKTHEAAYRFIDDCKSDVVILNFASAKHVGGGFLSGSSAQEEDLCRLSALYPCLFAQEKYYKDNKTCGSNYYTDDIIYSPKVLFFRDSYYFLLEKPYELSVITAPAPNLNAIKNPDPTKISVTFETRIRKLLAIAALHGHRNIILGAWGCGAFGNTPYGVAANFSTAIQYNPFFDNICFAVYDPQEGQPNYKAFKELYECE